MAERKKESNWLEEEPRLAPSAIKELANVVFVISLKKLDKILAEMKDEPKGKKAAVEIQFQLLPKILEDTLERFIADIEKRAESGCIIMPTVMGKRIFDKSFDTYLADASKMADEEARIRNSPGFRRLMNTPCA